MGGELQMNPGSRYDQPGHASGLSLAHRREEGEDVQAMTAAGANSTRPQRPSGSPLASGRAVTPPERGEEYRLAGSGADLRSAHSHQVAAGALLLLQLGALIAFGALQFHRYALSYDDAAYTQAWWLIAHGHPNPSSSVIGIRFLANDGELLIWLFAPLAWLAPSAFTLVVVQALAIVATNAVTMAWVLELVAPRISSRAPRV